MFYWKALLGLLEPGLEAASADRNAADRKRRVSLIQTLYNDLEKSVPAGVWTVLPKASVIPLLKPFRDIIISPPSKLDPLVDDTHLRTTMAQFIINWPQNTFEDLFALLPFQNVTSLRRDTYQQPEERREDPLHESSNGEEADLLLMYTCMIFSCRGCAHLGPSSDGFLLVGWDEVLAHKKSCPQLMARCPFEVSDRGRAALSALWNTLSTPMNLGGMDIEGPFTCQRCPKVARRDLSSRECLLHFLEMKEDAEHRVPKYTSLWEEYEWESQLDDGPY
ncbi:hypothetical protein DXG01_002321 [Tephrocybe rancida]|nr:hypothetical protein DXG01_002321 [Tephrocybe rancida]